MKKIVVLTVLLTVFAMNICAAPIYKYENTENITESVTLTRVREFHADHNISYSYIKMDLADDRVRLKLITSDEGTDVLDTVKNLALQDENTVAALNGDFFSVYSGNLGFSLGIEKSGGVVSQSPINPETMATVAYNGTEVLMSYLDFHVMVVAPNWEYAPVRHINKHTSYYGDILMYTSEFGGGYSPAPGGDTVEIVVENDTVVEFRRNMEPCPIPENGCVLVVSEGSSMFFANNFSVGDEIRFDWYVTPSLDDFDTAFGGGSMLVYEGKDVGKIGDYTHTVAGFHPRSAIGVDKEGKTLYLVAVDGRQAQSRGMRMSHLAELMIELGCYTAVNLDGGGSTNMVASTMWSKGLGTVNSPTENRRVINAVGIVLNNTQEVSDEISDEPENEDETAEKSDEPENEEKTENGSGIACGIMLRAEKDTVIAGEAVRLSLAVFNDNKRPVEYDENELRWNSPDGNVDNWTFSSNKGGKNIVGVSLGELYCETEIYVVDTVSGIDTVKTLYMKKGESRKPAVHAFDYCGRYVDVTDKGFVKMLSSDENVVSVKNGRIYAEGDGTATVTLSHDDAFCNISIAVGNYAVPYLEDFEAESGTGTVYPKDTKGSFELTEKYAFSGKYSGKLLFDFSAEAGGEEIEKNSDLPEQVTEDVSRAVYYNFDRAVLMHDDCDSIFVKVFSQEPFFHELKIQVDGADGKMKLLSYDGEIGEGEWSDVRFEIPDDVKRPVSVSKLYVLYTPGEEKDSGCIYFDDISFDTATEYVPATPETNKYRYNPVNAGVVHSVRIGALSDSANVNPVSAYGNENLKESILRENGYLIEKNAGMSFSEDDFAMYAFLDTSGGGIRNTSSQQWQMLVNAVNSTKKENIFILTNYDIFGNDDFENSVIKDYLSGLDKNVFVVSSGDGMGYRNINGVKYFTLDSTAQSSVSLNRVSRCNSIRFEFGETVSFKFESI